MSTNQVDRVNVNGGHVAELCPMSHCRCGACAVATDNCILVFGGCDPNERPFKAFRSCEQLEPTANRQVPCVDVSTPDSECQYFHLNHASSRYDSGGESWQICQPRDGQVEPSIFPTSVASFLVDAECRVEFCALRNYFEMVELMKEEIRRGALLIQCLSRR